MRSRHPIPTLLIAIAALAGPAGCGGPGDGVYITGKLLKGGAAYAPPTDQLVSITFVALETQDASGKAVKGGDQYAAEFDPEASTFEVPGPDRRGIPRGKYRVAVTQRLKREAFDAARDKAPRAVKKKMSRESDTLADRFGPTTSPIMVEVARSEDLSIDLDKPTQVAGH